MTDYYTAYLPGIEKRGKFKNKLKFVFIFILSVVATYYWLDREKPMHKTTPMDLLVSGEHTSKVPLAINDKKPKLKADKLEINNIETNNLEPKGLVTNKLKKEESTPVVAAQVIIEKSQLTRVEKKRVVKPSQIDEIEAQLIESAERNNVDTNVKNNVKNSDPAVIAPFIEKAVKQVPIIEDIDILELQKSYEAELGRLIINN